MKSDPKPGWLDDFIREAKIYTQSNEFMPPELVVVPDDGNFKRLFEGDIAFAWRPEHDAFAEWQPLYEALELPRISQCVTATLSRGDYSEIPSNNRLITPAAVQMTASWLRERYRVEYERLLEDKEFENLIHSSEECSTGDLEVIYTLDMQTRTPVRKTETRLAFWDADQSKLIMGPTRDRDHLKQVIAKQLARALLPGGRGEMDLATWLELILGAKDTKRLRDYNWSVPREIKEISEGSSTEKSDEDNGTPRDTGSSEPSGSSKAQGISRSEPSDTTYPAVVGKPPKKQTSLSTRPGGVKDETLSPQKPLGPYISDENRSYSEMLLTAFERPGVSKIDEEYPIDPGVDRGSVHNPERRGEKLAQSHRERIINEPGSEERRRTTEHKLLEPSDPKVRQRLLGWYGGRCQICGRTWAERDGSPFFVSAYLVEREKARWLDDPANAICLCADHFAQWRHATRQTPSNIIDQIEALRLPSQGGQNDLSLNLTLCGENIEIKYCEKHMIALKKLIEVSSLIE
ncbi:MAG: hypothetical protein R6U13_09425 [Desulfatiglandaceae bacterium]